MKYKVICNGSKIGTKIAYKEAHLNNFPAPALMIGLGWMLNKIGMQSLNMFLKISLS